MLGQDCKPDITVTTTSFNQFSPPLGRAPLCVSRPHRGISDMTQPATTAYGRGGIVLLGISLLRAFRCTAYIIPCFPTAMGTFVVRSTDDVRGLASALNCSGGTFVVEWQGAVIVSETIAVLSGSSLSIVGASGSGYDVADGNDFTRSLKSAVLP